MNGFADEVELTLLVKAGIPGVERMNNFGLFFATDAVYDFLKERKGLDTTKPNYHVDALSLVQQLSAAEKVDLQQRISHQK